ncbi:MAG: TAXI family TRAP transporter solute-binding subunit [Desulfamplus sp.]|nr:TAXI family TRAP transporter solute-binding subunit [Desulfamplus sp.]
MRLKKTIIMTLCSFLSITLSSFASSNSSNKDKILFGGGAAGSTFQTVVNAINSFKPVKDAEGFKVQAESSEGSIDNLKKIDDGTFQMGIVYSGDLWQGANGKIFSYLQNTSAANASGTKSPAQNSSQIYSKPMAVAYLYTASAHLIVHKNGTEGKAGTDTQTENKINSISDLEGKRVGVGNTGSGDYSTCELFLTHLGLWNKIEKRGVGYNDAARAFKNNEIDAFWVFSALPSHAVTMVADIKGDESDTKIELLNLGDDADKSGFLKEFPWFSTTMIKGGTYRGVNQDTLSFQDSAIWVANADVSADMVYQMLLIIYTDEGLKHLAKQNTPLKEMSIATGVIGIITPLHPGAEKFWKEKGILLESSAAEKR